MYCNLFVKPSKHRIPLLGRARITFRILFWKAAFSWLRDIFSFVIKVYSRKRGKIQLARQLSSTLNQDKQKLVASIEFRFESK